MGTYTELHFNADLKRDLPDNVVKALEVMHSNDPSCEDIASVKEENDHRLFRTGRWWFMLHAGSCSFATEPRSDLVWNDGRRISIRFHIKDYDDEIELFIDWIKPYLDMFEDEFLGFYRYEEHEHPVLVYMDREVDTGN